MKLKCKTISTNLVNGIKEKKSVIFKNDNKKQLTTVRRRVKMVKLAINLC